MSEIGLFVYIYVWKFSQSWEQNYFNLKILIIYWKKKTYPLALSNLYYGHWFMCNV
jgi:hypothetical protein